jgi:hypothetical protein
VGKNRSTSDIGAAQDLREWVVFTVDSGRFQSSIAGWGRVPGPPLRSSPGYNAIAPSALKRTYLLRNRRAESTRGNNPKRSLTSRHSGMPLFVPKGFGKTAHRCGSAGRLLHFTELTVDLRAIEPPDQGLDVGYGRRRNTEIAQS